VWAEVERPDHVEGDLAIKTEALEPDRGDLVAALVEGTDLCSVQLRLSTGEREIGGTRLTECTDDEAMLSGW